MKRELNELEYFQWIFEQPYNIVISVEVHGDISPNRLRIALDKIQQRHPLLGVTIILDEQGKPWFTSEGVGSIPLNIITQNNDEHKIQIVEHELSTIFVMGHIVSIALPLMRVTFLKDDSADVKRNNIIFCTQHIIADG
ncbi:MAG: hypothetical protein FK734_17560, partial [Asgard group archaeon]|nr:hypothetical protein [Asgard group archaeon]